MDGIDNSLHAAGAYPFKALAVCGPTAVGKSALGITLAAAFNGEVLNVDSVQVYRGFDIGAAKVPVAERCGVPHHLIDIFDPAEPANVARFRAHAISAMTDLRARGRLPVLVGGSGMYLTVLLHGLAEVPEAAAGLRQVLAGLSVAELYEELTHADPETAARLNPHDRYRVERAVEVLRASGEKPSELYARHRFAAQDVCALVVALCLPRDQLYARIEQRAAEMVQRGLLAETAALRARYGDIPLLRTLGYQQAWDLLTGKISEPQLVHEITLHTRRFAKRQMTYWRNEPVKRGWRVRPVEDEAAEEVVGMDATVPLRGRQRVKNFRAFRYSVLELTAAIAHRLAAPLERTEVWYVWLREGI